MLRFYVFIEGALRVGASPARMAATCGRHR